MVKFVNALTGGPMWVHESRVEEYLAAGHRLAVEDAPENTPPPSQRQKKETTKRRK